MRMSALVAAVVFGCVASAEEFARPREVSLILEQMGKLRERAVIGIVSRAPLDQIYKKVVREGVQGEGEDGPTRFIEGDSDGERLRVSLVQVVEKLKLGECQGRPIDLVLRYSHLLVERETVTTQGAMLHVQTRVYRVYFRGHLGPIVKRDVLLTPFGFRMPLPGNGETVLSGSDPKAIREWNSLAARLMRLGRVIQA